MMNNTPLVSIIIPVYNGANYLQIAIDSALRQSYKNIEIIVVNDGSNDEGKTEAIAKSYGDKIRYYHKENGGVSSALNLGISVMKGDYFSWLSHDDVYAENKVEDGIKLLNDHKAIGEKCIAFTGGHYVNSDGATIKPFKNKFRDNMVYSRIAAAKLMAKKGTLNGCCMLIPKSAFSEVGTFNEKLRYSQDTLLWYELFLNGYSIVSDNHDNVYNRLHKTQVSQLRRDLFEKDAVYVAKIIVPRLYEEDESMVLNYAFRLAKSGARDAVKYIIEYTRSRSAHNCVIWKLRTSALIGNVRFLAVKLLKKIVMK